MLSDRQAVLIIFKLCITLRLNGIFEKEDDNSLI